jgi:hypothetical protein
VGKYVLHKPTFFMLYWYFKKKGYFMTTVMDKVMHEIKTLTPREKGFVAQYIIASLDTHQDENSTREWELLARKRY